MDDDIRAALNDIKLSVREGFGDINGRIDKMVTKEAFDAEIRRLDAADKSQAEAHSAFVKSQEDDSKRFEKELDSFRVTTRWALGLGLTGAGVLSAIIFGILSFVANGHA